jgi:branched-subunit amino acid transport protein
VTATSWAVIGGCALVTFAIKGAGPAALGGRDLPHALTRVVSYMTPALLSALIVTNALADGGHLHIGADTAGVGAAGILVWRRGSIIGSVLAAAAVTAALRAL